MNRHLFLCKASFALGPLLRKDTNGFFEACDYWKASTRH